MNTFSREILSSLQGGSGELDIGSGVVAEVPPLTHTHAQDTHFCLSWQGLLFSL